MDQKFWALQKEATFIAEVLAIGVNQIRNVNYARKGLFFSSFVNISTGLERIGKLCLILDYSLNNEGKYPDEKYVLKYSHDLEKLYNKSQMIIKERGFKFKFIQNLDEKIHKDMISILSRFAKGDRYSNIDCIVEGERQSDPIKEWCEKVEMILYDIKVPQKKKEMITKEPKLADDSFGNVSMVMYKDEKGDNITSVEDMFLKIGVSEAIAKYRQLYILQIIRYWIDLLKSIRHQSISEGIHIPDFIEILGNFYSDDNYLKSRKTFDKQ